MPPTPVKKVVPTVHRVATALHANATVTVQQEIAQTVQEVTARHVVTVHPAPESALTVPSAREVTVQNAVETAQSVVHAVVAASVQAPAMSLKSRVSITLPSLRPQRRPCRKVLMPKLLKC